MSAKFDSDQFKYNPGNVKATETLGGGVTSNTWRSTVGGERSREGVFKPEPEGYTAFEKVPEAPVDMGVDEIGSRLSARSVASYKVDKMLGTQVLARTRFAFCTMQDGTAKFGSLQDMTGGMSVKDMQKTQPDEWKKLSEDPQIIKQLQHLQLVDYLTGQADRHFDNVHIKGGEVLGIDHDLSFPSQSKNPYSRHKRGLPKFVDEAIGKHILELERDKLAQKIAPYLSTMECEHTCSGSRTCRKASGAGRSDKYRIGRKKSKGASYTKITPISTG